MVASRWHKSTFHYLLSFISIGIATLLLSQIPLAIRQISIPLIYLLVVLMAATRFGLWPAMFTVLLAFASIAFFFDPPIYSLAIAAPQDILEVTVFSIVALITSGLADQVRKEASAAQQHSNELAILYHLSQTISAEIDLDRILPRITQTVTQLMGATGSRILIDNDQGLRVVRAQSGELPTTPMINMPILLKGHIIGAFQMWVEPESLQTAKPPKDILSMLTEQIGLAIERARLGEEIGHMRALTESDQLKSALLLSVSHDFRTPLSLIKGAISNVLEDDVRWDQETLTQFYTIIDTETDRLNRLVANLLDMARIEAGALHTTRSWQDIGELVAAVLHQLQSRIADRPILCTLPEDLPLIQANYTQLEQVLTNLLENAIKYTPPGTRIMIRASTQAEHVQVEICDEGPGIPASLQGRLFHTFVHSTHPEQHTKGTGLGLAICQGLITAHGGKIWVESPSMGGARFIFTLPIHAGESSQQ